MSEREIERRRPVREAAPLEMEEEEEEEKEEAAAPEAVVWFVGRPVELVAVYRIADGVEDCRRAGVVLAGVVGLGSEARTSFLVLHM